MTTATTYVKFFPEDLTIDGFKYKLGRNVFPDQYNPDYIPKSLSSLYEKIFDIVNPRGFKYKSLDEKMFELYWDGPIIGFIKIDDGVPIIESQDGTFKSPEINIVEFRDFDEWLKSDECFLKDDESFRIEAVQRCNIDCIQYFINPSKDVQFKALEMHEYSIRNCKIYGLEEKLLFLKNCGDFLKYFENSPESVYLEAERIQEYLVQLIKDLSKSSNKK